jgi:acyl-CoA thioester hydrolase
MLGSRQGEGNEAIDDSLGLLAGQGLRDGLRRVVSMTRPGPRRREDFEHFVALAPRWNDIDVFGHVNNVAFHGYFDTAVLSFLHRIGALSGREGDYAILVVENGAAYHSEVLFTDQVTLGLGVTHIGRSSVHYRLGVFRNDDDAASVDGRMVHVFTDRTTRRPVEIPQDIRRGYQSICLKRKAA